MNCNTRNIDSNVVERAIRRIALNRKNALFAGADGGGEHWTVIASLIETNSRASNHTPTAPTSSKDRQRSPEQPSRRSGAMRLSRCPGAQGRGLRTTLTLNSDPGKPSAKRSDRGWRGVLIAPPAMGNKAQTAEAQNHHGPCGRLRNCRNERNVPSHGT